MGWAEFTAAFIVFFLVHSVRVRASLRRWLVGPLGQAGYGVFYSVSSLGALAWLFVAAGRAPFVPLWAEPPWAQWLVLAAMIGASLILSFGLFRPNPLSFGGWRNETFDPANPGLIGYLRHPVLVALFLWSAAHLVMNGDLAHVLMFGSFALFALLGMRIVDRRRQREMGIDLWRDTVTQMRQAASSAPEARALRIAAALGGVLLLLLMHPWFAGVSVLWRFLP